MTIALQPPDFSNAVSTASWSFGPPAPRASFVRHVQRGRRQTLRSSLRAQRSLRRVEKIRLAQAGAPALGPVTIGIDTVLRSLRARPALALLGLCVCAAIGAHGALALGSANLRPKRAHKERVVMSVAAAPADEVLPEPAPAPPPERARPAGAPAPTARVASQSAPSSPGLPISPALMSPGGGFGPALGGGGVSASSSAAPAANAAPDGRDTPATTPRVLVRTPPRFPAQARAQNVEGRVTLSVLVDSRGRVAEVRVLESEPEGVFDAAAIEAVRRWTFAPATRAGAPTDAWVRQVIRFTLD